MELPEELWESILNRLAVDGDYGDLRSPSLACKKFLSIANRLRQTFVAAKGDVFCRDEYNALSRALERFRNVEEIKLYRLGTKWDVNYPILKIACSGLDLQSLRFHWFQICPSADTLRRLGSTMNNLNVLRCTQFPSLRDTDLVHIGDALPRLEELDIRFSSWKKFEPRQVWYPELSNHTVTDAGIEAISHKLRGLSRIDISWNERCSDLSLIALSSNCVLLSEIKCDRCNITRRGIDWLLGHSTQLTSLRSGHYGSSTNTSLPFDDMKISATGLREIDIGDCDYQERLLCSIAKAGVPLEKLSLRGTLTQLHAVTTLLRACPTLKHLQ
ncbi:hypothetical protein RHGRI_024779 [Rhododendron griersonianum]|uniref:F-box domain-containing protein n=1 Tax=Rhododendron griersonianum TaxID=479676 RepID=A0AAV6J8Q3_9ERIC|nr:hypothetical protein RHGRI_024779 [Rhododendron griersonianum]